MHRRSKKMILQMKFQLQKGASCVRPEGQAFGRERPMQRPQAGASMAR